MKREKFVDCTNLINLSGQLLCACYNFYGGAFRLALLNLIFAAFFYWVYKQRQNKKKELEQLEVEYVALVRRLQLIDEGQKEEHEVCRGCKYYHGKHGLVCAVHPNGVGDNFCVDKQII